MENSLTAIDNKKIKLNTSLEDMISHYLELTGKASIDCEIIYSSDKGFISYLQSGDTLLVPDLYGDGKYWLSEAEKLAKKLHCTKLKGGTTRNPKAYNRMFGTKVVGYILEKDL